MKKTYETPTLEVLGTAATLTQANGATAANDTIIIGSSTFNGFGSVNGPVHG